jgi:hypothetical protein
MAGYDVEVPRADRPVRHHRSRPDRVLGVPGSRRRLTPGHGFQDTLHPDSDPFGALTNLANQFAAMPSLHIAWSTW